MNRLPLALITTILSTLLQIVPIASNAATLFVNSGITPGGDCSSWAEACPGLQYALDAAAPGDEIWIAQGAYTPGSERNATFQLVNGVALYGGFSGTETSLGQRDWETNPTVLSGDVDDNDDADDNGIVASFHDISGSNAYHVVTGSGTDSSAVLDGFIVTGGSAGGAAEPILGSEFGGGLIIVGGSPTLRNLVFVGNTAFDCGGGIYAASDSAPLLDNVIFRSNSSFYGGGMCIHEGSSPALNRVTFQDNEATERGGALRIYESESNLTDSLFIGNRAYVGAGVSAEFHSNASLTGVEFRENNCTIGSAIYSSFSAVSIHNATFRENLGRVIFNTDESDLTLVGVAIVDNVEINQISSGIHQYASSATLRDVTISGNPGEGMESGNSFSTLLNVAFRGNGRGGMRNYDSTSSLTNVLFSGNRAGSGYGGGFYNWGGSAVMTNVTFNGNFAHYRGGAIYNNSSALELTNCILWSNTAQVDPASANVYNLNGETAFTSSLIHHSDGSGGLTWGTATYNSIDRGGNIDADPLFVSATDPMATPTTAGNNRLRSGSPAVDAGSNLPFESGGPAHGVLTDLAGFMRLSGPAFDLGAYELNDSLFPDELVGMVPAGFENGLVNVVEMAVQDQETLLGIGEGETEFPSGSAIRSVLISEGSARVTFADDDTAEIGIRSGDGLNDEFIRQVLLADSSGIPSFSTLLQLPSFRAEVASTGETAVLRFRGIVPLPDGPEIPVKSMNLIKLKPLGRPSLAFAYRSETGGEVEDGTFWLTIHGEATILASSASIEPGQPIDLYVVIRDGGEYDLDDGPSAIADPLLLGASDDEDETPQTTTSSSSGCSVAPKAAGWDWLLMLLPVLANWIRRRNSQDPGRLQ
jgi:hypothetical protein